MADDQPATGGWLDKVHLTLDVVGTVASFLPGAGNVVAAVAEGINATIYLAEAKVATDAGVREEALRNAALSAACMVPFGKIAAKTAKGLAKTKPLAKHATKMVAATEKAKVRLMRTNTYRVTEKVIVETLSHPSVTAAAQKWEKFASGSERLLEKGVNSSAAQRTLKMLPPKWRPKKVAEAHFHIKNKVVQSALRGVEKGSKEELRIRRMLKANRSLKKGTMPKRVTPDKQRKYGMRGDRTHAMDDFGRLQYEKQRLLKLHGANALPYVQRLTAEYHRQRALTSLMHRGVPFAKDLAMFGLEAAFPMLDVLPWATGKVWDWKHTINSPTSTESSPLPQARDNSRPLLRDLSPTDERQLRNQAVAMLKDMGIAVDINLPLDQLLTTAMVESALQQVADAAATRDSSEAEGEGEMMAAPQQWPAMEVQIYDFVSQLAGFLPPKYQPVANLILKVGGVTAGVEQLTPESFVSTLLPFIGDAKLQEVVGMALKLRSLQQQIAGLSSASAAGQLATMQASLALISTVLSLIPGIPPELQQAIQMVSAVLKLAHLLSIGAPPLMVLTAIIAIVQLSMGFGSSKRVDGGSNNSGQGRAHNRPGGQGPEMPDANGNQYSSNGERVVGRGGERERRDPNGQNARRGRDGEARGSRGGGGRYYDTTASDGFNVQGENGNVTGEEREAGGDSSWLVGRQMEEAVSHVANAMGYGNWVTNEDAYEQHLQSAPSLVAEMEEMVGRLMGGEGRGVRETMSLRPEEEGDRRTAFAEEDEGRTGGMTAERARGKPTGGMTVETYIEPDYGDEKKSKDLADPALKDAEMTLTADVSAIIASELALLADPETENVFWAKFVNQALVSQSQVQAELLELADREMEERKAQEEAAVAKKQKELAEENERRQKLNREWEESMAREEKERTQERIAREQQRRQRRLREDDEIMERLEEEKRRRVAQQQQSHRKKKRGCAIM